MITWDGRSYDAQALTMEAKYFLDRVRTLTRLIDKQTEIFNDARLSLEAMLALRKKDDAALMEELKKMEPKPELVETPPFD